MYIHTYSLIYSCDWSCDSEYTHVTGHVMFFLSSLYNGLLMLSSVTAKVVMVIKRELILTNRSLVSACFFLLLIISLSCIIFTFTNSHSYGGILCDIATQTVNTCTHVQTCHTSKLLFGTCNVRENSSFRVQKSVWKRWKIDLTEFSSCFLVSSSLSV